MCTHEEKAAWEYPRLTVSPLHIAVIKAFILQFSIDILKQKNKILRYIFYTTDYNSLLGYIYENGLGFRNYIL